MMIDIDGCICEHVNNEEPEKMATPPLLPGAIEQVSRWYDDGHYICFFTARTEEHRAVTEQWLAEHGFKYHQIIFNKPRGGNYYYIDDRPVTAIRFHGAFDESMAIPAQQVDAS